MSVLAVSVKSFAAPSKMESEPVLCPKSLAGSSQCNFDGCTEVMPAAVLLKSEGMGVGSRLTMALVSVPEEE